MKKTIFAGLITLLPFAVTFFLVFFLLDILTAPFVGGMEDLLVFLGVKREIFAEHGTLMLFASRIIVLVALFLLTLILGVLGRRYLFKLALKFTHKLFSRVPFVRSIYKVTKDITKNFFSENTKPFKETVVIPFPHENTHTLGFWTGRPPPEMQKGVEDPLKTIFIPTSPHPISGYVVMYSEKDVKTVDISTEDVFKILVSCGLYDPDQTPTE